MRAPRLCRTPTGRSPLPRKLRLRMRVFPLPPELTGFLTSSKPPSSLRKAPGRGAERKHAASVRNEDHVWGRRHQSAAARVGGWVVKAPARPEARGGSNQRLSARRWGREAAARSSEASGLASWRATGRGCGSCRAVGGGDAAPASRAAAATEGARADRAPRLWQRRRRRLGPAALAAENQQREAAGERGRGAAERSLAAVE